MREAARAIVQFGFAELNAEAIEACYATWNHESRKVLEAIGMSEAEFLPQGFQKRGAWVPEYRMRIERSQSDFAEPSK